MQETTFKEYKQQVESQGRALLDAIQSIALGDLDIEVQVPEGVEVLSELAVGLGMMVDDLKEAFAAQQRARNEAEEAQTQLQEALEEVLAVQRRYIREGWEQYTSTELASGYVRAEDQEGVTGKDWLPAMTRAVDQGQVVVEQADEQETALALPILSYGEVVGALGFSRQDQEPWSPEQIEVVKEVADQVAQALESQRLLDEQQRASALMSKRVRELDCLSDIGRKVDETPPISEFLIWVTGRLPAAMQYPDVCLVAIEFQDHVYGAPQALTLPRQMVQGMRVGGELVGRICVSYTQEHEFLDEESALLGDVARRISGYVENRQLLYEAQSHAERERRVRTVTDRIRRATDAESIMRVALEDLSEMLKTSKLVVRLGTPEQLLE